MVILNAQNVPATGTMAPKELCTITSRIIILEEKGITVSTGTLTALIV